MAPFTRRLIFGSFSIWKAARSRTVSRIPAASPASTIETYRRLKTFGWRDMACESRSPPSTSARSSWMTAARYTSSVCSSRMTSALTTLRPASIIVANWREKIWSDFGLIFLKTVRTLSSPDAGSSARLCASRPRTRSCSRAPFGFGACTSPESSSPWALIAVYATDTTYRNDSALGGILGNDVTTSTGCSGVPPECNPSRTLTGADRHNYRLDTYVTLTTPPTGRQEKLVTVVVRGSASPYATYAREQSTFDLSTGS